MKTLSNILFATLWFVSVASIAQSQTPKEKFSRANALYNEKKYEESIVQYNELLRSGYIKDEVYYNLGNALYRNNNAAAAIWCYEKCLLLNASHEDAAANLAFVNKTALGNQEIVPENFFIMAWNWLSALMSWQWWTNFFIIVLVVFLVALILFLTSASNINRKIFFLTSVILFVVLLLALAQSISGNYNIHHSKNAIVVDEAVQLRSSPDKDGTGIAMIQPGIKVHILEIKTPWLRITTPDGTQGWVPEERVVRLNAVSPLLPE
ncbi:MAG TPA: SH3 domain-containing protein [Bacteroidales bacterium]|nr:SH3 domain-containing protein [Bacteroidales bacterium]